jgi:hypothetical protein
MSDNYYTMIQGGEGPDVWDREVAISAADFSDAFGQASAKAEELGGQVVSLEQLLPGQRVQSTYYKAGAAPDCLCCGYKINPLLPHPVMWNPFNKVVQCHNCGTIWRPEKK